MKAIIYKDKTFSIEDVPMPNSEDGEVLVRVLCAGICNTDVELLQGYMNFSGIPGHEFVGVVEEAPDPDLVGKRVVADINVGCGDCSWCNQDDPRHCPNRTVIGIANRQGAFAEYIRLPRENLHVVDGSIPTTKAVFVEPLAAALEISQQVHLQAHDRVAVLGDGKLGILIACSLRHFCPEIILIGKHSSNLQIAANQNVRTRRIASLSDLDRRIPEEIGPCDIVIEATGRPDGVHYALNLLRPEGKLVLKTTSAESGSLNLAKIVVDEIEIIGSRCGRFELALHYLKENLIDTSELVEATYPLDSFADAFALAISRGSKKVILTLSK
ncbi:MDR/zinc-dependent alcohol dehydrogenase-like family protein [Desulfovibrio inopinatus]|uniref:MDR/zinc-dependent alcohol dehydrogenase-like family protein n=1 Tax=Desulfovibrio inopinatus TaxID=102109 RepID=UPI0003FE0C61|nr:alcohol dehydrogenase catalytic domain-containing protein [Desulfovibrio inopinatus]